jgi:4-diphosphocytidyl-2-C-methyl-D-erythritol kinase
MGVCDPQSRTEVMGVLEGDAARETHVPPVAVTYPRKFCIAGKTVEDHGLRPRRGIIQHRNHIPVSFSIVDLDGQAPLGGECQVVEEALSLSVPPPLFGAEVVQPGLTDGHNSGLCSQLPDPGECVVVVSVLHMGRVIGMKSDRGSGARIVLGSAHCELTAGDVVADQNSAIDSHTLGSVQMLGNSDPDQSVPEVQMRVIVHDRHRKGFRCRGVFKPAPLLGLLIVLAAHRTISLSRGGADLRPVGSWCLTGIRNSLTHSNPVYPQPPQLSRGLRHSGWSQRRCVVRARVEGMRDSELFGHVTAVAPGKVNLSLRVGPARADGYHEVATLYYAVSLYEEVIATPRSDGAITVSLSERSSFTSVEHQDPLSGGTIPAQIPLDENNLAHQAAVLLRQALQERDAATLSFPGTERPSYGVDLTIIKNVPIAGGMGGGSADAAATLVACSALWEAGLTKDQLAELGARLGADVPFAIFGGAAVGQGVGENLSPLLARGELHLVMVPASTGLSTPEVYKKLDSMRESAGLTADQPELDDDLVRAACAADAEMITTLMSNDLQAAAVAMLPELDDMMDAGMAEGAMQGMVSGSGPTLMFLARDASAASQLATGLQERLDVWAIPVSGPAAGARLL